MTKEYESHESYGMIQINTRSGGPSNLFGSSIPHSHRVALSIHPAEIKRDLAQDWFYHGNRAFIEIEMSYTQFAEAIIGMNTSGTPCTVRYVDGRRMEDCPFTNKRQQFQREFAADMQEMATRLDKVEELARALMEGKAPSKADRTELLKAVQMARQQIESNVPFLYQQFDRQMDATVKEAQGEFEAAVQRTIHSLGLQALKAEDFRLLASGEEGEHHG